MTERLSLPQLYMTQCKRHGFNPWSRKIPHPMEQLSLSFTTELSPCSETREYPPLITTRESPCTAMKTQHTQEKKEKRKA